MKGASTIISVVLVTGIVATLITAAYSWGIPLVYKGQASTTFQSATSFAVTLNQKLTSIANAGGEASLDINPPGLLRVIPFNLSNPHDTASNSIIFEVPISQPLALNNSPTYIGGVTFQDTLNQSGTFGEAPPSIISFRVDPLGTQWKATYTIHFRVLKDPLNSKEYIITLNKDSAVVSGLSKINMRFGQNTVDPNSPATGERILSNVVIDIA